MANSHRPSFLPPSDRRRETKDRESATESIPPSPQSAVRGKNNWWIFLRTADCGLGKGEMVGGHSSLNLRAHQQPGDRLARQTPPGARPNKGAGLVRSATTLG
jgi:hypothetical protein